MTLTGGLLVFLLLLFFAVQLTINLYARSQVTAAGFSAARNVAGYENDQRREHCGRRGRGEVAVDAGVDGG